MNRQYRIVAAARGKHWFQAALGMLDRNPRGLLLTTLAFILIGQVPDLFSSVPALAALLMLATLMLGPALLGGLMHAIAEADAGRPVSPLQLFEAFRRPGVMRPLLLLGLLSVLALLLLGFAAQSILGADNIALLQKIAAQQIAPQDVPMEQLTAPLMRLLMVAAAVMFVLLAGMFFAVPRVLFDRRPALAAFVESIACCAANVLPMTVYGLLLIVAAFALALLLGVVSVLFGILGKLGAALAVLVYIGLLMLALLVSAAGNYLVWRELFDHTDVGEGELRSTGIEA